jgi:uncharacterized protein YndB with AHSA1/START domain
MPASEKIAKLTVRHAVHVPVQPSRAFEIFTQHAREWWNPATTANPTKSPIADIVIEPRIDGRWYERGVDGSVCEWARVLAYDPASRLAVDWHPDGVSTTLEISFENPAPRRTDVTLVHYGFEGFSEKASRMREVHDQVWSELLDRFAKFATEHPDPHEGGRRARQPRAVTDGETVLATVDVSAAPDRVFRALTTAETEKWWGAPDTYRTTQWKSDVRVGGHWSCVTRLADGTEFPASGDYLAIEPNRRVVQTRRYEWDYPELGRRDTTVTYIMNPIATGTRVTVRHEGFAGLLGAAEHHVDGWEGFLGYLAKYVDAEVQG